MALDAALALNVTGHVVGTLLYAMLVGLVVRPPGGAASPVQGPWYAVGNRLALLTGLLGATWNLGALATDLFTLSGLTAPPWLHALAFSALGYLPAVVVYSVLSHAPQRSMALSRAIRVSAVLLATAAAVGHVRALLAGASVPDRGVLWALTVGASLLLALLLVAAQSGAGRRVWVAALAVFAASGFHLTGHDGHETWPVALVGHHASLPLAVAILQQEYRFAFADLFLKRALALLVMAASMLGAWLLASTTWSLGDVRLDAPVTFTVLLALGLASAVSYPHVRRAADRVVDRRVLGRLDPDDQRAALGLALTRAAVEPDVLTALARAVARAVEARETREVPWPHPLDGATDAAAGPVWLPPFPSGVPTRRPDDVAVVVVPTVHAPHPAVVATGLQQGRRLLSGDLELLASFAVLAARRIDALRDEARRLAAAVRDEEVGRLATEAELRAVRAQLNPHFLFNALNTIRHLIDAAPDRAGDVLMQLTGLLRGVLTRTAAEFSTLGSEIDLLRSYLAIERARFEDRLRVDIDVPESLHALPVPALLLQPLVENAVRHGIAPARRGGQIRVLGRLVEGHDRRLVLTVEDTGIGAPAEAFRRVGGVGLASVERRLALHYGAAASVEVASQTGGGTCVVLTVPIQGATSVDANELAPALAGDAARRLR